MKAKAFFAVAAVACTLTLSSCGSKPAQPAEATVDSTQVAATQDTTMAMSDSTAVATDSTVVAQ